ncbi:hypothetical protein T265_03560 [Opisthorchis viverrini]|uniref:Uncharacterized protein n=1 Tax=Opisthorchis viverrini TaxID=6198 RepID=A0A075AHG8_OPIVI|nr:hypothetical protein T265_03560 [Opisthorchis viverrini]KER29859.1 hypothetical protein T265_03560 [Opisthorchis viverrini]
MVVHFLLDSAIFDRPKIESSCGLDHLTHPTHPPAHLVPSQLAVFFFSLLASSSSYGHLVETDLEERVGTRLIDLVTYNNAYMGLDGVDDMGSR